MTRPTPFTELGHGITCIDADFHRPGMAACYLMVEGSRAAFIETGTRYSVAAMVQALEHNRILPTEVEYVIITHVHLDHAGGAGQLMQLMPNAKLVVHPRGARHMIDPSKLTESAKQVYGEAAFLRTYGSIEPIAAERVIETQDEDILSLNGRPLQFFDTQGHAKHHFCVWDAHSRGIFTGDTFGISYRELDYQGKHFLFPTTTPTQFDPEQAHKTVDRLAGLHPQQLYLTHFGMIPFERRLVEDMHRQLQHIELFTRAAPEDKTQRAHYLRQACIEMYRSELMNIGHPSTQAAQLVEQWLMMDMEINAQGLEVWLEIVAQQRAKGVVA
ncbi:beta-lactamase domain protein [Magnetococcus marinus MC-1]|uniref:Beta-lactamase domain protein n=1 Tax=Magnetococcus marinus (strain ATCC BAA-1437 / JCM 17883 / MC-1) TaxID=156889 RepID=A0L882_MAGMM|nr:MBL fold metallo-hydrolase [Magnetococcus marinus]ABK44175.1 beta-lactamase domain protein [Magnetococcus marinus MC-1]